MKTAYFNYNLPKELIAQEPKRPRDHSRLLLLDRITGQIDNGEFYNIIDYLRKGDVLVLNNSKVFPARLIGRRKETGGRIEIFLNQYIINNKWNCLIGGRRVRTGLEIEFNDHIQCIIEKDNKDGTWEVKFNKNKKEMMIVLEEIGQIPLPPYIKSRNTQHSTRKKKRNDKESYQTVYADDKKTGSAAAPTAGFHFTPALIKRIKSRGIQIEYLTLHVGLGTFAPVKVEDITKHKIHPEYVEINKETITNIYLAKSENRRIIAVGTTSTRALEAVGIKFPISNFKFPNNSLISNYQYKKQFFCYKEQVGLFIYPGFKFKIVDAMITNFHLPKSTLLMLVSAFAGKENIDKAYKHAIKNNYRFYSYGDAMFIY